MKDMPELLSVAELQKLTQESESCWRKRLGRREISYLRLGANVRIRREDFERWLEERAVARRERT